MFWLSVRRRLTKRSKLPGAAEMPSRNKDRCNVRAEGQERRPVKENGVHTVNGIKADAAVQEPLKSR